MGRFERAGDFGTTLRHEARRRGLNHAQKILYLGDGAAWIWELAQVNFPGAVLILDFYHIALPVWTLPPAVRTRPRCGPETRVSVEGTNEIRSSR